MTKEAEHAIEVQKLTKRYGDLLAVNDISFNVRKGEVFALLGPNGAGKTTTVEIIDTIRTPTSGKVSLLGMDVTKKKHDIFPRIGVLPQGFSSFDRITVRETLQYYSRLFCCMNTDIDGLIDLVNLKDKAKEQYKNLSGGLKQRLGIAIALVNDPEVVFLDEPTAGVTPAGRDRFWKMIHLVAERGKTVFVTTHYMDEAEQCGRIALMREGRIVASDSPAALKKSVFPEPVFEFDPIESLSFSELAAFEDHEAFSFFEPYGPRFHAAAASPQTWAAWAPKLGKIFRIRPVAPSLEDVFIRVVQAGR